MQPSYVGSRAGPRGRTSEVDCRGLLERQSLPPSTGDCTLRKRVPLRHPCLRRCLRTFTKLRSREAELAPSDLPGSLLSCLGFLRTFANTVVSGQDEAAQALAHAIRSIQLTTSSILEVLELVPEHRLSILATIDELDCTFSTAAMQFSWLTTGLFQGSSPLSSRAQNGESRVSFSSVPLCMYPPFCTLAPADGCSFVQLPDPRRRHFKLVPGDASSPF